MRIGIVTDTCNNSAVSPERTAVMERKKVLSIQRQNYSILGHCDSDDFCVALSVAGLIGVKIPDKFDVVAEPSQTILDSRRELLIGQETGHFQLSSFSRI